MHTSSLLFPLTWVWCGDTVCIAFLGIEESNEIAVWLVAMSFSVSVDERAKSMCDERAKTM
jgi:hypothetical protein